MAGGRGSPSRPLALHDLRPACRLLGGIGDMTHKRMIEDILRNDHFASAHEQGTDALRL